MPRRQSMQLNWMYFYWTIHQWFGGPLFFKLAKRRPYGQIEERGYPQTLNVAEMAKGLLLILITVASARPVSVALDTAVRMAVELTTKAEAQEYTDAPECIVINNFNMYLQCEGLQIAEHKTSTKA